MKRNNLVWFVLMHVIYLVYSLSGIFSKHAAAEPFLSGKWILWYAGVLAILGGYAIAWQQILKHIPLNTAYMNKAVTCIWGMLWGVIIFRETVTLSNLIGGGLVIAGIVLIGAGQKSHEQTD